MPKIMQKKRERTQQSIIKAAAYLFEERGYDETAMEAIAERAEIAAGTLYNYYASKPILLMAIYANMTREIRKNPPKRSQKALSKDTALADIVEILEFVFFSSMVFPKPIMRQIFAQLFVLDAEEIAELMAMDMEMVAMLKPIMTEMQSAGMLSQETDVEAASMLLFGSVMTLYQTYISVEALTEAELKLQIASQAKMILFGLLAR